MKISILIFYIIIEIICRARAASEEKINSVREIAKQEVDIIAKEIKKRI